MNIPYLSGKATVKQLLTIACNYAIKNEYISKEVECGTVVPNLPLSRNCNWEDSIKNGHCPVT